jgi:hypothetical protein
MATKRIRYQTARGRDRMVLNQKAIDAITAAAAEGLFDLAQAIVNDAQVPDAPPYGKGLVEGGGVLVYVKGASGMARKVYETTIGGRVINKPKAARIRPGATAIFGYGFPGRFVEFGTAKTAAQPFLTPSLLAHVPDASDYIRAACIRRKATSVARAAAGDTYQASRLRQAAKKVGVLQHSGKGIVK